MILVTGAAGFIGRQVCRSLSVRGLDVLASDRALDVQAPARAVAGDLTDKDFIEQLFRSHRFKVIVHLAGVLNTSSRRHPEQAMRINIGSSLALLGAAVVHGVSRFIFGSSISTYGPKPYSVHGLVRESDPASPNNVYGVCKRYVEIAGEDCMRREGLEFVALRISMAVGAGAAGTASRWRSEIFEKLRSQPPVRIDFPYARSERLPLVHVEDASEMIGTLVTAGRPAHTIYNTPSDNLPCGDLADSVHGLNPGIEMKFSPSEGRGDPEAIDGSRFTDEFGFRPLPIQDRFLEALSRL